VQNTHGAEMHADLKIVDKKSDPMQREVVYVKKGNKDDIDSYSAFFDNCKLNETTLNSDLKRHGISEIYVCGLAADVCVGNNLILTITPAILTEKDRVLNCLLFFKASTAVDGLELNYRVVFVDDACRGIDLDDIENQKKLLAKSGAVVVKTDRVRISSFFIF
jgi:nicotinamidase-related amidase